MPGTFKAKMIDMHSHVITERMIDLMKRDQRFGVTIKGGKWVSKDIKPFALLDPWFKPLAKLAEMDEQELDASILSAAPKPLFFYDAELEAQVTAARELNLGLAEFCEADPTRLAWMANVPLAYPKEACAVLEEAVAQGAVGVHIATTVCNRPIDGLEYEQFWSKVEELGIPVFLHPAYERELPEYTTYRLGVIVGLPVEVTITLERFIYSGVLDRHPEMTVIGGLGGGYFPYSAGRLRQYALVDSAFKDLTKRDPWSYVGQIVFDCFLHDVGQIRFLIEHAGVDNVMIGTDASFVSIMPKPVQMVREAVRGNEDDLRRVGETNPLRIFPRLKL